MVYDALHGREVRLLKSPLLVAVVWVERVQDLALNHFAHYLPHRVVVDRRAEDVDSVETALPVLVPVHLGDELDKKI